MGLTLSLPNFRRTNYLCTKMHRQLGAEHLNRSRPDAAKIAAASFKAIARHFPFSLGILRGLWRIVRSSSKMLGVRLDQVLEAMG